MGGVGRSEVGQGPIGSGGLANVAVPALSLLSGIDVDEVSVMVVLL